MCVCVCVCVCALNVHRMSFATLRYRRLVKGLATAANDGGDGDDDDGSGAADALPEELLAKIQCPDQNKFNCDPAYWRQQVRHFP
jgi:hypothetical protein